MAYVDHSRAKLTKSPWEMLPVSEALDIVLGEASPLAPVPVLLAHALGCVCAKDVVAASPFPPFRASVMDGYAVVAADGPGVYPVARDVTAGQNVAGFGIKSGQVAYITTGAPVPSGADAVVMVENTKEEAGADGEPMGSVRIKVKAAEGQAIRPVGLDISAGSVVVEKGAVITATELGLLAMVGCNSVLVHPKPRVSVMSTGDEIVDAIPSSSQPSSPSPSSSSFQSFPSPPPLPPAPPSSLPPLGPGQIYDANRPMLLAAAKDCGAEPLDFGLSPDNRQTLEEKIRACIDVADVCIFSGGVSMGSLDLMQPILHSIGGSKIHFGRICMKPGKPTTFATVTAGGRKKLVFALPGNPVSAFVTFQLLAVPAIRALAGYAKAQCNHPCIRVAASRDIKMDPVRPEYHRVGLVWEGQKQGFTGYSTGSQMSSRLLSMRHANGLMLIPKDRGTVSKGTKADTLVFGNLLHGWMAKVQHENQAAGREPKAESAKFMCRCESAATEEEEGDVAMKQRKRPATKRKGGGREGVGEVRAAVLTISDSCSQGTAVDRSGPKCVEVLLADNSWSSSLGCTIVAKRILPDDQAVITEAIKQLTDTWIPAPHLIITTGGTGFSPRDVTPEAVGSLLEREAPGLLIATQASSFEATPMASLSRPVAGIRKNTVILTLPGNPKAVPEVLQPLLDTGVLAHIIQNINS